MNQPELSNRFSECNSLLRIANRGCQNILRSSDGKRAEFKPAQVQNVKCNDVAAAHFAQQIFNWHLYVIEVNRAGRTSLNAHLLFFRSRFYSLERFFHQKSSQLVVHLGEHSEQIRRAAIGNPHLLPVEDVEFAVFRQSSSGTRRHGIRTRMGFAQTIGRNHFARGEFRQVAAASVPQFQRTAGAEFQYLCGPRATPHTIHLSQELPR